MNEFDIRRPVRADAPAIHELVAEHDIAVTGKPDWTLEDIADTLGELDLANDSWLVDDGDRLLGWAWARRKGTSDNVDIDVHARDARAGDRLWDTVIERAVELGRAAGHEHVRLDIGIYAEDTAMRTAAKARGFDAATSFHRMRIDHQGAEPVFLPGVTVETGSPDHGELLRTAHRIQQEGFAEHFGFVARTYEEWAGEMEASSANDWGQLLVARVHGEPAAMLLGTNHFVPDENCGYVRTLAVLPRFRGKGLGRFLLRRAFAADERRGRAGTILHVDSNNTTPALDLYLSVGMRPVLAIDVWRRLV
ncbi:GNAT family N-acetyltransferase [Planotetraspora sp. A-T 1434]|uniref:GNAT family N-acetyltransferase n=1 Tax=Planotetraspora sp. A-T 1434 TaxID=2979219 RepID=UPI0021C1A1AD|nr:GNAT family N-acetyltransferase [Planotetraspora sp. A-T 1434]MCT9929298.1 GNAT family N-acetyltransferase [Planotetraspora sp. A-T 1434]